MQRPNKHWRPYVQDYAIEAMHCIYLLAGTSDGEPVRGVSRAATKVVTQTTFVPFDEVRRTTTTHQAAAFTPPADASLSAA